MLRIRRAARPLASPPLRLGATTPDTLAVMQRRGEVCEGLDPGARSVRPARRWLADDAARRLGALVRDAQASRRVEARAMIRTVRPRPGVTCKEERR